MSEGVLEFSVILASRLNYSVSHPSARDRQTRQTRDERNEPSPCHCRFLRQGTRVTLTASRAVGYSSAANATAMSALYGDV